jgi:hypothetical protein
LLCIQLIGSLAPDQTKLTFELLYTFPRLPTAPFSVPLKEAIVEIIKRLAVAEAA